MATTNETPARTWLDGRTRADIIRWREALEHRGYERVRIEVTGINENGDFSDASPINHELAGPPGTLEFFADQVASLIDGFENRTREALERLSPAEMVTGDVVAADPAEPVAP